MPRLPEELSRRLLPRGRPFTRLEALVDLELDREASVHRTHQDYARRWHRSWKWVRALRVEADAEPPAAEDDRQTEISQISMLSDDGGRREGDGSCRMLASASAAAQSAASSDVLWPRVRAAFALYGRNLASRAGRSRADTIRRRARERCPVSIGGAERVFTGPELLEAAVHGYVWLHRGPQTRDFDAWRYFMPETIFRPSKLGKYVQAYAEALEAGASPPFDWSPRRKPGGGPSFMDAWQD